jgi:hypothetical protein
VLISADYGWTANGVFTIFPAMKVVAMTNRGPPGMREVSQKVNESMGQKHAVLRNQCNLRISEFLLPSLPSVQPNPTFGVFGGVK